MVAKVKCRFPKLCKYPHTDDGECDKFCSFNTRKVKTNGDRIRSMSDVELAEVISNLGNCDTCYLYHRGCSMNISCKDAVLEWLRKEVEDG